MLVTTTEEEGAATHLDAAPEKEEELQKGAVEKALLEALGLKILDEGSKESCQHKDVNRIAAVLRSDSRFNLRCRALSGGQTNYSYKVYLQAEGDSEEESDDHPALFAKAGFNYALWNPDRSQAYDVGRLRNEFEAISRFAERYGEATGGRKKAPVAAPLFCLDVALPGGAGDEKMKVLVTEWSSCADAPWADQFVRGEVDCRVARGYAEALAALHAASVDDPSFNDGVRPSVLSMLDLVQQLLEGAIAADDDGSGSGEVDKCLSYLREMGARRAVEMLDAVRDDISNRREVYCHGDADPFNVLVEPPPTSGGDSFGPRGTFAVVDWEMSIVGPAGRDVGLFLQFPLACAFRHGAAGDARRALHLLDVTCDFVAAYVRAAKKERPGSDDEHFGGVLRSAFGSAFLMLTYGQYFLQLQAEFFPKVESERRAGLANGATGYVGIRLGECAFCGTEPDLKTWEDIARWYRSLVADEIAVLTSSYDRETEASDA